MSRRTHGGGIAAAALALALALATPAHAAGLNGWDPASGLLLRAWHWLTGGWAPVTHTEPQGRVGRRGVTVKEGMGIDPQGGHSLGTGSTGSAGAPGAGVVVDPNG
jgi:hypothetical protein